MQNKFIYITIFSILVIPNVTQHGTSDALISFKFKRVNDFGYKVPVKLMEVSKIIDDQV